MSQYLAGDHTELVCSDKGKTRRRRGGRFEVKVGGTEQATKEASGTPGDNGVLRAASSTLSGAGAVRADCAG